MNANKTQQSLDVQKHLIKKATTIDEQFQILKSRGLTIKNEEQAKDFFKNVSYYRLSGYCRQFYKPNQYERFSEGTDFTIILNLYAFDTKLRLILFELIQEIEISFKARLGNEIACKFGEMVWKEDAIFNDKKFKDLKTNEETSYYHRLQEELKRKLNRAKREPFIKHHIKQYNEQFPIWVLMEIIDFSDASKIFKNLKTSIKKDIKRGHYTSVSHQQLEGWLEQFVKCRNICAHHGRIVGKENFKLQKHTEIERHKADGFFALLIGIKLILNTEVIWESFLDDLESLIKTYNVDLKMLALPENWKLILK